MGRRRRGLSVRHVAAALEGPDSARIDLRELTASRSVKTNTGADTSPASVPATPTPRAFFLKTFLLLSLLAVSGVSTYAAAQQVAPPNGDPIRSLATAFAKKRVRPGQQWTNVDGVQVINRTGSTGDAWIDPEQGSATGSTTVDTRTGFDGEIKDIDSNDTVNMGSSATGEVKGDGGTINLSGGSSVRVTNTGTGGDITVNLPSGGPGQTVHPGGSVTFNT